MEESQPTVESGAQPGESGPGEGVGIDLSIDPVIAAAVDGWDDASVDAEVPDGQTEQTEPEAQAAPEEPAAKPEELDHAKARKRAEFLQRRAARVERLETQVKEREARVANIERQLTSDDARTVFEAVARMRGTSTEALIREAMTSIADAKPTPEQELERLRAEVRELREGGTKAQQQREAQEASAEFERGIAQGIEQYEYLKGEDPAELVEEGWALARSEYAKAVRLYGASRVRAPTHKDVLESLNNQRRKIVERFGGPKSAEIPGSPSRQAAASTPRAVAPTQRQTAAPAQGRALEGDDLLRWAAEALD